MTEIIPNGTGAEVRQDINTEFTSLEAEANDSTIVRLVNGKLPAVDGSLLTNISTSSTTTMGIASNGSNLVPVMTSETSPSGLVFSSQAANGSYAPFQAFDNDASSPAGYPSGLTLPFIIGYKFTSAKVVASYTVDCSSYNDVLMSDWTFEGSNNTTDGFDGTWTTLDTVTGHGTWSMGLINFAISNTTSYIAYRIKATAPAGARIYGLKFNSSSSFPANPQENEVVFNISTNKPNRYVSGVWEALS